MAKVKERAALTGVRNAKRTTPAAKASARPRGKAAKKSGGKAKAKAGTKSAAKRGSKAAQKKLPRGTKRTAKRVTLTVVPARAARSGRLAPVARYAIKELDPLRKCGPGTSVQFLYRVDESVEGRKTAHLVFFDRHGWYCEHGRTCPAVAPARKHNGHRGHIARVS